jgi:hypothetical protein
MVLDSKLLISVLDFISTCVLADAQNFVIISFFSHFALRANSSNKKSKIVILQQKDCPLSGGESYLFFEG